MFVYEFWYLKSIIVLFFYEVWKVKIRTLLTK